MPHEHKDMILKALVRVNALGEKMALERGSEDACHGQVKVVVRRVVHNKRVVEVTSRVCGKKGDMCRKKVSSVFCCLNLYIYI